MKKTVIIKVRKSEQGQVVGLSKYHVYVDVPA